MTHKWLLHFKNTNWLSKVLLSLALFGFIISPLWLNTLSTGAELARTQKTLSSKGYITRKESFERHILPLKPPEVETWLWFQRWLYDAFSTKIYNIGTWLTSQHWIHNAFFTSIPSIGSTLAVHPFFHQHTQHWDKLVPPTLVSQRNFYFDTICWFYVDITITCNYK